MSKKKTERNIERVKQKWNKGIETENKNYWDAKPCENYRENCIAHIMKYMQERKLHDEIRVT